jgi:cupin superfamily protein
MIEAAFLPTLPRERFDMSGTKVLTALLGGEGGGFRGLQWSNDPAVFRSNPEWFQRLTSLDVFRDPEQWLDRATELLSFPNLDALARSEARRRYLDGQSIYILGLERTVRTLRDLCDGLAADLALEPRDVRVQAWAAGNATSVGMHFDLDYNFNLQITGRKQWKMAPNDTVANPISSHHAILGGTFVSDVGCKLPSEMPEDAQTLLAEPGDVVYVPRGMWHATCTTEATFAMAFVIQPLTWADHVARALTNRLHADARWRERVMGARQLAQHAQLKATAHDVIAASRDILADIGPSEMLYRSLWGQKPAFFRRCEGIVSFRFDESSGTLTWQSADERREFSVPLWAQSAIEFMLKVSRSWSIAAAHDLVSSDEVPFLNVLVRRLVTAGFLEDAPAAVGGIMRVPDNLREST